jgi:uncharacterized protein YbaR (Trm112 family)
MTSMSSPQSESLDALLACPKCHGSLKRVQGPTGLVCESCKLFFSVEDDLPNMLLDDAKPWPLGASGAS